MLHITWIRCLRALSWCATLFYLVEARSKANTEPCMVDNAQVVAYLSCPLWSLLCVSKNSVAFWLCQQTRHASCHILNPILLSCKHFYGGKPRNNSTVPRHVLYFIYVSALTITAFQIVDVQHKAHIVFKIMRIRLIIMISNSIIIRW